MPKLHMYSRLFHGHVVTTRTHEGTRIDVQITRSPVAHPKAQFFGPSQAWPSPIFCGPNPA